MGRPGWSLSIVHSTKQGLTLENGALGFEGNLAIVHRRCREGTTSAAQCGYCYSSAAQCGAFMALAMRRVPHEHVVGISALHPRREELVLPLELGHQVCSRSRDASAQHRHAGLGHVNMVTLGNVHSWLRPLQGRLGFTAPGSARTACQGCQCAAESGRPAKNRRLGSIRLWCTIEATQVGIERLLGSGFTFLRSKLFALRRWG